MNWPLQMVFKHIRTAHSQILGRRSPARLAGLFWAILIAWGLTSFILAQDPGAPPKAGFDEKPNEKIAVWDDEGNDAKGEKKGLDLPAEFVPRGEPAAAFNIKEEWRYQPYGGDEKALKRATDRWRELMRKGVLENDADRKTVHEVVRYRLSQFTLKEARDFRDPGKKGLPPIHELRKQFLTDLVQAENNAVNLGGSKQFRDAVLKEIVDQAPELFTKHFVARLNAVILLAELNQKEPGQANSTPPLPYVNAYEPLLQILQPDKPGAKPLERQPDALRVWAVKGLVRIAEISPASGDLRNDARLKIVNALIAAFEASSKSHPWYQMRLAEGLGLVDAFRDNRGRATIAQALLEAVMDPKRPMIVRAEAAQALGRVTVDANINVSLIAVEIAKLAGEVAENALKQPAPPETKMLAFRLYAAFQAVNKQERSRSFGLLNKKNLPAVHQKAVRDAYQNVLPIVSAILNDRNQALLPLIKNLKDWIASNKLTNPRISPEMEPIAVQHAHRPPASGPADG